MCIIGVSDASYHQEESLVAGEMIMIGNKDNRKVLLIYWRSGVIRMVCTSPKAAKQEV